MLAHRWAGLTIALFLVVAGLTGAVLPFEETLTFASRPDASRAAPPWPGARPLDGLTIAARVERATGSAVPFIDLTVPPDRVVRLTVAPRPGGLPLAYDTVWADPYTGAVRLTYRWGGVRDGVVNVVPFLYSLHYGLIAGPWGEWAFGVAALIWTIDCFVGLYLTFPVSRVPRRDGPSWLRRWLPGWRIRRARGHKLTFDLHRAGGLWLWPLLFVFAWSGVALALPQVATPVMRVLGAAPECGAPPLLSPLATPPIAAREALTRAIAALRSFGKARGFTIERPTYLFYDATTGDYTIYARTSLDLTDDRGGTGLRLDGRTGRALALLPPAGATRADAFVAWIEWLHMAQVFGLPWRVAVSAIGLFVTGLSVTGVMIWMRKRTAKLLAVARRIRKSDYLKREA